MLLADAKTVLAYQYHGINMTAQDIAKVPSVEALAARRAGRAETLPVGRS